MRETLLSREEILLSREEKEISSPQEQVMADERFIPIPTSTIVTNAFKEACHPEIRCLGEVNEAVKMGRVTGLAGGGLGFFVGGSTMSGFTTGAITGAVCPSATLLSLTCLMAPCSFFKAVELTLQGKEKEAERQANHEARAVAKALLPGNV